MECLIMTNQHQPTGQIKEGSKAYLDQLEQKLQESKADLIEKERIIQLQYALILQQVDELKNKQKLKEEMLVFFYLLRPLLLPLTWLVRPLYRQLKPRLGVLKQYPPRELHVPANYSNIISLAVVPKISIVTPSYNQSAFLERTLKSILDQSYPDLEYLVQDGGSIDGTVGVLKRYDDRLTGWASCADNGQAHAINIGFSKTSGEIMAWLNSDDVLLPGALFYVADYFSRNPDVDVVYGHRVLIDENDRDIGRWMMPQHRDQIISWADFIPQETMFWRRRIWEKAGGQINESLHFAVDWDLLLRFREAGARFARLPRFLGGFRIHSQQKTSAEESIGFQEMSQIRVRTLGRIPSQDEITKAVSPYLLEHVVTDIVWRIRNKLGLW
jgi:hypothetical protein